jgi:hypothetical protein
LVTVVSAIVVLDIDPPFFNPAFSLDAAANAMPLRASAPQ